MFNQSILVDSVFMSLEWTTTFWCSSHFPALINDVELAVLKAGAVMCVVSHWSGDCVITREEMRCQQLGSFINVMFKTKHLLLHVICSSLRTVRWQRTIFDGQNNKLSRREGDGASAHIIQVRSAGRQPVTGCSPSKSSRRSDLVAKINLHCLLIDI